MKLKIMTERNGLDYNFFQVVYEWEDQLFKSLSSAHACEYTYLKRPSILTKHTFLDNLCSSILIRTPAAIAKPKKNAPLGIYFTMIPWDLRYFLRHRSIPIILDATEQSLYSIQKLTKRLPFYYITSMDMCALMKERYPASNVRYMPQCISDQWLLSEVPEKTIDVVQIGRKNDVLHEDMLRYCASHPQVNYTYLESKDTWDYISTTNGNIGKLETRDEFMALMKKARVCLLSTPGMQGNRFGSTDFFTARFYESAINYCRLIGRYTENEEANFLNISSICKNVTSYEEFEAALHHAFEPMTESEKAAFDRFIANNLASKRAEQINEAIAEYFAE